jgi:hypothetical protein
VRRADARALSGRRGTRRWVLVVALAAVACVAVAGTKHWLCDFELPAGEIGGGGGACTTLAGVHRLDDILPFSCGGSHRFRLRGLVPDGVTGLKVERADGRITRTIPVTDNFFAFSIGHVDFTLRGVGDAVAEEIERSLPLAGSSVSPRDSCGGYAFTEVKPKPKPSN